MIIVGDGHVVGLSKPGLDGALAGIPVSALSPGAPGVLGGELQGQRSNHSVSQDIHSTS